MKKLLVLSAVVFPTVVLLAAGTNMGMQSNNVGAGNGHSAVGMNQQGGGMMPGGNGNQQGGGTVPGGAGNQQGGGAVPGGTGNQQGEGTSGSIVYDTFMVDTSVVGLDVRNGVWVSTDQTTKNIVAGTNLTQMAVGAAAGMSNLVAVDLRSSIGLTEIPSCAFAGCVNLERVVLPTSVTSIADDAFIGCTKLASITVEEATAGDSGNSGSGSTADSDSTGGAGDSDQQDDQDIVAAVEATTDTTPMVTAYAQTFYGYTCDSSGTSGTVTIKTSKANVRTGIVTVKVTLWPFGGKKTTVSTKITANTDEPTVVTFPGAGLTLTISGNGITGSSAYGTMVASRDFSTRRTDSRYAEYDNWIGAHSGAFATTSADGDAAAFAGGYSTFSIRLAKKGVARIVGNMGDGTAFSQTTRAQLSVDGSTVRIPVLARLYRGRTGGFGFVFALDTNGTVRVESVADWDASSRTTGSFTASLSFVTNGVPTKIDRKSAALTVPALEGATLVSMSLSSNASTGVLRGTYRVILPDAGTKRTSVTLRGVSVGGKGYATSIIKKQGSYPTEVTTGNE